MSEDITPLTGHYTFENGHFVPHEDMELINKKIKEMKFLIGSTETGKGDFYFDPVTASYWQYLQYENYKTELIPVSLEFIEANFSEVELAEKSNP